VSGLVEHILHVPAWLALLVVFGMPALEASTFLGFVFPGEIACLLGGVLASQHRLPIGLVIAAAVAGAVIGDNIGYWIGHHYGEAILRKAPQRLVKPDHVQRAKDAIRRLGGRAVFVGRFTTALRVLVPGLCGIARMRYRTFTVWNFAGGALWAGGVVILGFLAGAAWKKAATDLSYGGLALLAAVVLGLALTWFLRRRRASARQEPPR
jgi:undecaprenyl-diphosphatase